MRDLSRFECLRCGNCCRPRGQVRLQQDEAEVMADFLGLELHDFTDLYTRLTPDRRGLTLVEQPSGACIMLTPEGVCRVNPVKPHQCRGFPYTWTDPELEAQCAGLRALEED